MPFDAFAATAAILGMLVPGVAMGFALFRHTGFSRIDKTVLGGIMGIALVPLLLFLEYLFLGIGMNAMLVLANELLVLFAGIGLYYAQGKPDFSLPKITLDKAFVFKYWPYLAVLLFMAVGFFIRFVTGFSTTFFEFDPYYYEKLTERLVQNGFIPAFSSDSFFPEQAFQHWPPLSHYLTGAWIFAHQMVSGLGIERDTVILVSQIYPPLMAALMAYLAFALLRERYSAEIGVIAAGLMTFTPQLITKFGAGVAEQQPWSLFATLLVFTAFLLALHLKSYRVAVLAVLGALAVMMGSQQFIWPLTVISAFIAIQGVLDFLAGSFDGKKWVITVATAAALLVGNTLMAFYQNQMYVSYVSPQILLLVGAVLFQSVLFAVSRHVKAERVTGRAKILAAVGAVTLVVGFASGFLGKAIDTLLGQAQIASAGGALTRTVAEEGRTFEGIFQSAFGVLNPLSLLLLGALVTLLVGVVVLVRHKHKWTAGGLAAVGVLFIFFQQGFGQLLKMVLGGIENASLQTAIGIFTESNVFGYLLVALLASSLTYLAAPKDKRSEMALLLVLIVFPIAFVGLNKVKYVLHLGFALVLLLPYLLGETRHLLRELNEWFSVFGNAKAFQTGVLAVLMFMGVLVLFGQAQFVQPSMDQLQYTRIPSDWVEAYQWMSANTPLDTRVMSWWDYGHWTTFLGERDTVLNPSNLFADFNQGVARAFVDGNPEDLYDRMEFHEATHVLVDSDLIGKWGALVFLSGTCSRAQSPVCPDAAEIDYTNGPGQNQYEAEHYFESLSVSGNCPASALGVPLPMAQSSFGARYCLTRDQMLVINPQTGQLTNFSVPYKIAGRDEIPFLEPDTAYLFPTGQNAFLNINPQLDMFGLDNKVINAAFTRLYFVETLPGFELVHRTPNNQVKIFKYNGRPGAAPAAVNATASASESISSIAEAVSAAP